MSLPCFRKVAKILETKIVTLERHAEGKCCIEKRTGSNQLSLNSFYTFTIWGRLVCIFPKTSNSSQNGPILDGMG